VLAFLCARFRDLEQIIRNLLQLAFFVTPVFWKAELVVNSKRAIVDYNVLFYFIEIIRAPLLGQVPPLKYYAIAFGCTVIGYMIAVLVYQRMRRRLAFFVA
jgi:ABC-2 type transport system permease protein/lipopolysaccharide transport system permease protein